MQDSEFAQGEFRKASGSGDTGCVEVAIHGKQVGVRDSKDKSGPVLGFNEHEWRVFVKAVKDGEFDI